MNKYITLMLIIMGNFVFSQVGIATETPHASSDLELGATNRALYLNRVADPENDIADPQSGMMLYDTTEHCVKVFAGDPPKWSDCMGKPLPVITFDCSAATFTPASATVNQPYNGSLSIPYTNGNGGAYQADSFTAGELTFNLPAGNFATGNGALTYQVTGTPTVVGPVSVDINQNGVSCTGLTLNVNQATAPTNPTGTGSLSGRMCFDVVEQFVSDECGTIVARTPQKANFFETATNTQTYTFKPTGTVSNIRFMYFNTNGQVIQSITPDADYSGTLTSAQTATATVVFYNNLNASATSLSRENALLGDIYVVYYDGTEDKQVKLTTRVQDCNCCGAYVTPTLWKEFACHNLGADTSLDPFTPAAGLHGDKYQWGAVKGESGRYISMADDQSIANISPWLTSAKPGATWEGANDPCFKELGAGWRVPTRAELQGLIDNNPRTDATAYPGMDWSQTPANTNFSSGAKYGTSLFLPAAGFRWSQQPSTISSRGSNGRYRSVGSGIGHLSFSENSEWIPNYAGTNDNAMGWSVRCIAQ